MFDLELLQPGTTLALMGRQGAHRQSSFSLIEEF